MFHHAYLKSINIYEFTLKFHDPDIHYKQKRAYDVFGSQKTLNMKRNSLQRWDNL